MPAISKVLSKCCKINDTVFRLPHGSRYLGVWKVFDFRKRLKFFSLKFHTRAIEQCWRMFDPLGHTVKTLSTSHSLCGFLNKSFASMSKKLALLKLKSLFLPVL